MRKNVYTKSMLRKPVHSLILALLIFIATFSFVLRSVEFLTVREEIFRIASFYPAVGFLSADNEFEDVNIGADFLENSHFINLSDRRRGAHAFLQGMLNTDVDSSHFLDFQYNPEYRIRFHDAFFYGELIDKIENPGIGWRLVLTVDDVLVGYPEHVVAGQELRMNFELEEGDASAIANMEIGERYFLRGIFDPMASPSVSVGDHFPHFTSIPSVGNERNVLLMQPLYSDGRWYINVPHGETIDLTMLDLEAVIDEVEFLHRNHHEVQLQTTMDMTLMPFMLGEFKDGFLIEGRLIDQEDYLNANPVAVIHRQFARLRDLSVGDTITINIPQIHYVERERWVAFYGGSQVLSSAIIYVEGPRQDEGMHEIELEIVGIYNLFQQGGGDFRTFLSTYIYIPDSALPDDMIIISNRWGNPDAEIYLPSTWYSFTLRSSRYKDVFVAENRFPLEEMGFTLTMIESDAQNFWESANVILQTITFNGVVFSIVLVLVLLLVNFLFLRQRRKEFAINRMLGHSSKRVVREAILAAILFLVPIIIGSIFAWLFARHTIVNTLQVLDETQVGYEMELSTELTAGYETYESPEALESVFSLSLYWLAGLTAVVFILMMLMVFIGAIKMTRRPVLELLQGKG